jgi:hypothetical protein
MARFEVSGSGNGDPYPTRDGVDPETRRGQPTLDFHYSYLLSITSLWFGLVFTLRDSVSVYQSLANVHEP